MPNKVGDIVAGLRLVVVLLVGEGKRDLEQARILDRVSKDDGLRRSRRVSQSPMSLRFAPTPIFSSSTTSLLYTMRSSPSLVRTGTPSNRARTHCSSVSRLSRPSTTSFIRRAQYFCRHHSMSSARGSRFAALGCSHSVLRSPVPNLR